MPDLYAVPTEFWILLVALAIWNLTSTSYLTTVKPRGGSVSSDRAVTFAAAGAAAFWLATLTFLTALLTQIFDGEPVLRLLTFGVTVIALLAGFVAIIASIAYLGETDDSNGGPVEE